MAHVCSAQVGLLRKGAVNKLKAMYVTLRATSIVLSAIPLLYLHTCTRMGRRESKLQLTQAPDGTRVQMYLLFVLSGYPFGLIYIHVYVRVRVFRYGLGTPESQTRQLADFSFIVQVRRRLVPFA